MLDFFSDFCYNKRTKEQTQLALIGRMPIMRESAPNSVGDEEIAVQICGNSHYRNFFLSEDQVGMLIGFAIR